MPQQKERFILDQDYNGATLVTDGVSFYAEDKKGKTIAEAKSLQAVKNRILKPLPLDIEAVQLDNRYAWDDEDTEPKRMHIYAVSGAGAILYETPDGKKDKDTYDSLRRFDQAKLDRWVALRKTKRETEKALEELLESWPKLKAKELREQEESKA